MIENIINKLDYKDLLDNIINPIISSSRFGLNILSERLENNDKYLLLQTKIRNMDIVESIFETTPSNKFSIIINNEQFETWIKDEHIFDALLERIEKDQLSKIVLIQLLNKISTFNSEKFDNVDSLKDILNNKLESKNTEVRNKADIIKSLPKLSPELNQYISDPNPNVRKSIIFKLDKPGLEQLVNDPDPVVSELAKKQLSKPQL
jgi:hypothetical protein